MADLTSETTPAEPSFELSQLGREFLALRHLYRPHYVVAGSVIVLCLLGALAEGLGVGLAVLFLYMILGQADEVGEDGLVGAFFQQAMSLTEHNVLALGGVIAVLLLATSAAGVAYEFMLTRIRNDIAARTAEEAHAQLLRMPYSEVQAYPESDLINLIDERCDMVSELFCSLVAIVTACFSIVGFCVLLLLTSWPLALGAIAGALALLILFRLASMPIGRLSLSSVAAHTLLMDRLLTTIQGMRVIRAFSLENLQSNRFNGAVADRRKANMALDKSSALATPIGELGHLVLLGLIVIGAAVMSVPFASALAIVALLHRMRPHVADLETHVLELAEFAPNLAPVRQLLLRQNAEADQQAGAPFSSIERGILLKDVTFTYPNAVAPSLRNVTCELKRGRTIALVGPSGAGKTTLVNILLRLYPNFGGRITVDHAPLNTILRADWLARVAIAGQDTALLDHAIEANVRTGRLDATAEEIGSALAAAGLSDVVAALSEGKQTKIGTRGASLSGGQRQRLAIARAIIRKPALLILDEATSTIEPALERKILTSIRRLNPEAIILLITHRSESAEMADEVLMMEKGSIVGFKTPQDRAKEIAAIGDHSAREAG